MIKKFSLIIAALVSVWLPAHASNLTKAISGEAEFVSTSHKGIFDLERCLLMSDFSGEPNVYRSPDRPNETMLYYANAGKMPVVIIENASSVTKISMWNDRAGGLKRNIKACA